MVAAVIRRAVDALAFNIIFGIVHHALVLAVRVFQARDGIRHAR
jgi:hypothetical protein